MAAVARVRLVVASVVTAAVVVGPFGWPLGGHRAVARVMEGDRAGAGGRMPGSAGSVVDDRSRGTGPGPLTAPAGDADDADDAAVDALAWPVAGRLVSAWDEPAGPYGPGHRGVDLAVDRGQPVSAMGVGVVGWAGTVAGTAWVSVDHVGGMRTTVGPMATIVVAPGEVVGAGTTVGTAAGTAHATSLHGPTGALHVSVRIDGVYVDPTSLVGRLVPTLLPPPG